MTGSQDYKKANHEIPTVSETQAMTQDQKTFRSMAVGMALIIGFSAAMHLYLIKKKAIQANRYEPSFERKAENPDELLLTGGGTLEGEVVAASFDKFFLRVNGKVQPFLLGDLTMPEVGTTVSVSFAGGRPPTATLILDPGEKVPPAPPESSSEPTQTEP